jgi:hypothetical protein
MKKPPVKRSPRQEDIACLLQNEAIEYRDGLVRCNIPFDIANRNLSVIHDFISTREIVTLLYKLGISKVKEGSDNQA